MNADAGTLYIRKDDWLFFAYMENDTLFPEGAVAGKSPYSNQRITLDRRSLAGFTALAYIKNQAGKLFDPDLVSIFVSMKGTLQDIRARFP